MIFNLILKMNLKMIFDLKIDFESDFESDFQSENDFMFHVKHENEFTKSPFMGRKLYYHDSVLSRTFFKKIFGAFAARVLKKRPLKRSFLPSY